MAIFHHLPFGICDWQGQAGCYQGEFFRIHKGLGSRGKGLGIRVWGLGLYLSDNNQKRLLFIGFENEG